MGNTGLKQAESFGIRSPASNLRLRPAQKGPRYLMQPCKSATCFARNDTCYCTYRRTSIVSASANPRVGVTGERGSGGKRQARDKSTPNEQPSGECPLHAHTRRIKISNVQFVAFGPPSPGMPVFFRVSTYPPTSTHVTYSAHGQTINSGECSTCGYTRHAANPVGDALHAHTRRIKISNALLVTFRPLHIPWHPRVFFIARSHHTRYRSRKTSIPAGPPKNTPSSLHSPRSSIPLEGKQPTHTILPQVTWHAYLIIL